MPKWRNGITDKSQSCKITVPLKLKLLFHWNLHLLPNIFSRLILTNKGKIYNDKSLVTLDSSLSLLFLNKMVAFCFDIGRKRFVYLVLTIEKRLWRYALSSSDNMKWIIKTEPTSRWILYTIFGQHVLCTETEWRWMFVSNRYRVLKLCSAVQICNLASTNWKKNPVLLGPFINTFNNFVGGVISYNLCSYL